MRVGPWTSYLRRNKVMGRDASVPWADVDTSEKKEDGEWWHAALEDQEKEDAVWNECPVETYTIIFKVSPLTYFIFPVYFSMKTFITQAGSIHV